MHNEIHVSALRTFMSCRRRYDYNELRLLSPKTARPELALGTAFHEGLSVFYTALMNFGLDKHMDAQPAAVGEAMVTYDDLMSNAAEDVEKQYDLLDSMLVQHLLWYERHRPYTEIIAVEEPYCREVGLGVNLCGTPDMVVRGYGGLWVVDHKTVGQFWDANQLMLDDQMTSYMWLVSHALDESVTGALYTQYRKKIPARPEPITNGKRLSKTVKDTTYEVYMEAIEEYGFDPADYTEILEECKQREFVQQTQIYRSNARVDVFEKTLTEQIDDLQCAKSFYPNPTWLCSRFCDFFPLCVIQAEGGDVQPAIDGMYERDERFAERRKR